MAPVGRHQLRVLDGEFQAPLQAAPGSVVRVQADHVGGRGGVGHGGMVHHRYSTRQWRRCPSVGLRRLSMTRRAPALRHHFLPRRPGPRSGRRARPPEQACGLDDGPDQRQLVPASVMTRSIQPRPAVSQDLEVATRTFPRERPQPVHPAPPTALVRSARDPQDAPESLIPGSPMARSQRGPGRILGRPARLPPGARLPTPERLTVHGQGRSPVSRPAPPHELSGRPGLAHHGEHQSTPPTRSRIPATIATTPANASMVLL